MQSDKKAKHSIESHAQTKKSNKNVRLVTYISKVKEKYDWEEAITVDIESVHRFHLICLVSLS
jgi:hypothetical protein